MIDSIYVALSGMRGHERALNVIGNNVTNMNTLGFRGSIVNFADVYLGTAANGPGVGAGQRGIGGGVDASRTTVDFQSGIQQTTGNALDLALDGDGFFIVQDETGAFRYTRAGDFDLVDDELVLRDQKIKVMTRDANGQLVPITVKDLRSNAGKATSEITLAGTFQTPDPDSNPVPDPTAEDTDFTIESVEVFDQNGRKHTLQFEFAFHAAHSTDNPSAFDVWRLSVTEKGEKIGTGDLSFAVINPQGSPLGVHLELAGTDAIDVKIDYRDVLTQNVGTTSNVSVAKQDGFAEGQITQKTVDPNGVLKLTYSNGQKADGPKLALAQVIDQDALVQVGDALLEYRGRQAVTIRDAADDLKVLAGKLEGSNVDLTTEFSQLILMQRGYQASSQVVSTANDMLQALFDIRGRR